MDIFGYSSTAGGNFTDTGDTAVIVGSGEVGLIQDWNVQYQLQATPLYECGSSKVYFAAKHGAGSMTVNRVYTVDTDVMSLLGTICKTVDVQVNIAAPKCDNRSHGMGNDKVLTLKADFVSQVSYSGRSTDAFVTENVSTQFASLDQEGGGDTTSVGGAASNAGASIGTAARRGI